MYEPVIAAGDTIITCAQLVNFDVGGPGYIFFNGLVCASVFPVCCPTFAFPCAVKVIPEMKELVEDLRARGWRVVIVTASPTWIVEPGARHLGFRPEDIFGIEVRPFGSSALGGTVSRGGCRWGGCAFLW